jgi:hypothetical protein
VSAFVAAHSTAQEVFSAHFADDAEPSSTAKQDTGAKASSTSMQDERAAAAADTCADAAAGSQHIGHNSSSRKAHADTSTPGDQPSSQGDGTGFPPKSCEVEDTDTQLAHKVVQESRAEADAALQYAHNVSPRCVVRWAYVYNCA